MSSHDKQKTNGLKAHKLPEGSVFYDRILPVLFIVLAVVMAALIVFAIGVLTGVVPWV